MENERPCQSTAAGRGRVCVRVQDGSVGEPDAPELGVYGVRPSGGYEASSPGTGRVPTEGISVVNHSQTFLSSKNYVLISEIITPIC